MFLCSTTNISFQVLLKYSLFIYYQSNIKFLLKARGTFWNYNKCKHGKTWLQLYKNVKLIQVIIVAASFIVAMLYCAKPIFLKNSGFILETWIFTDSFLLETTVLFCQYYYFCIAVNITIGYDLIYFSLCIDIIVQLRLLKCKIACALSNVTENITEDIRIIAQYHLILLG